MIRLDCPSCGAQISQNNIDREQVIAQCAYCDTTFSVAEQLGLPRPTRTYQTPKDTNRKRSRIARPNNIEIREKQGVLLICWSWFGAGVVAMTFFCLLWNGILFVFIQEMFGNLIQEGFTGLFPFVCFPHIWIGLGIAYYVLAGYINETTLIVNNRKLQIRHGPLPMRINKNISASDIKQLYTKKKVTRSSKGGRTVRYQLHAVFHNRKQMKLLGNLESPSHALYVEQEVERHLRITDQPIKGEYAR